MEPGLAAISNKRLEISFLISGLFEYCRISTRPARLAEEIAVQGQRGRANCGGVAPGLGNHGLG